MLKHYPTLRILLFVLAGLILGCAPVTFLLSQRAQQSHETRLLTALNEANTHNAAVVRARLHDLTMHASAMAGFLGAQSDFSRERSLSILREPGVSKYFTRMALLWEDGTCDFNCDTGNREQKTLAEQAADAGIPCPRQDTSGPLSALLQRAVEHRSSLLVLPRSDKMDAQAVVLVPVFHQGQLKANLAVAVPASGLQAEENGRFLGGDAVPFLVDSTGKALQLSGLPLPAGEDNIIHYLATQQGSKNTATLSQELSAKLLGDSAGVLRFATTSGAHLLAYAPVGESGWHAMTLLFPGSMTYAAVPMLWIFCLLAAGVGLLLLLLALRAEKSARAAQRGEQGACEQRFEALSRCMPGAYFVCAADVTMSLQQVSEQLCALTGYSVGEMHDIFGNSFLQMVHENDRSCLTSIVEGTRECLRTEYRVLCKDGKGLWVRERRLRVNGTGPWHCVLTDISELMRLTDARQMEADRADVLVDMAGSMLYDYNTIEGTVQTSKAMSELFDIANPPFVFDRPGLDTTCIHPDDIDTYMLMRTRMLSGAASCEGAVRVRDRHGSTQWYHVRMRAIIDTHNRCVHIIGRLSDAYDAEDLPSQRQKAQHDALTGLLTEEGVRGRANAYVTHCEPDMMAALCLIEVDSFGDIAQQYGRLVTEELLTLLGGSLRSIFRPTDLLARLGEERFAVLVKDMRDKQGLLQKLHKIQEACTVEVTTVKGTLRAKVSMGVAFFPTQGRSFEQLHTYAEAALLTAHKSGGGAHAVYGQ